MFLICLFFRPKFLSSKDRLFNKTQFENMKQPLLYFIYLHKVETFNRYMFHIHIKSPCTMGISYVHEIHMYFMFIKPIFVDTYHASLHSFYLMEIQLWTTSHPATKNWSSPLKLLSVFWVSESWVTSLTRGHSKTKWTLLKWLMTSTSLRQYLKPLQRQYFHE